ncbi:DNA topoisomerase, related [Eimeria mitis]|uniref:DNA topoisomerase n=1 Tax=Eimeria mitis TaxID=44415 RepID=U6K5A8_9EIME|nr:DNA topoisomerase, related [Eimeria mitis]CDJ32904.1 DNA topoisomerase, related [Eimeria mitis]
MTMSGSSDAIGFETKIEMDIAGETFSTTGLVVLQKNYLEVYPYDTWASRRLPRFLLHERFIPNDVTIQAGSTQPPTLLTEADLIDKMDKERNYAVKTESQQFKPTDLGVALVKGYKLVGRICNADLSRPDLRASMERDMTLIARGAERKEDVIQRHVGTVAEVFRLLRVHIALLDDQLQRIFPPLAASDADCRLLQRSFCTCAKCGSSMDLMDSGSEAQITGSRYDSREARSQ